ncbi:mitochondrial PGP phosphatase [Phyllosticta citribraziliensis]|uniref:Mitochondrial PGP phosphatase n=1 Tax=Phyllosticta citribraziliensis TaxID=989973 RepID=A0ABR1L6J0_9PEZI
MREFNLSGTLNVLRLLRDPALCLPHYTCATFNNLPIPLSKAFPAQNGEKDADIRAVILDKDNCFATPHTNHVYPKYKDHFAALRAAYPGSKLLIVSNTAGTRSFDADGAHAAQLERDTGVQVLVHNTKKPGCAPEVLAHLLSTPESGVTAPSQVAVVGDRLFTDVMTANLMGARAVWIRDGVVGRERASLFAKVEQGLAAFLLRRGWLAPTPVEEVRK